MEKKTYVIECRQVVCYKKELSLTDSEAKRFKEMDGGDFSESKYPKEYSLLLDTLTQNDVTDVHNEFTDFQVYEEPELAK